MRYIAAYLLLKIAGNDSPTAADITKVIKSVGIEVDKERVSSLLSELDGKDVNALIAEGSSKLASVPSGGGAVAAASTSGGGAAPAAAEAKEEEKEEKEESDDDMGFGLFD
ncbi:hypothetical protein EDB87DRAFT_1672030 [Lactarius vividus]|nr:hypothetical protein EDB87DRAFT_1672030 [Lactarius vividus]KAH9169846.1 hypothetical protein EDB89DRAFT_1888425 [Lactarius sanguifluus]